MKDQVHPSKLKINDKITITSTNGSDDHVGCVFKVTKPITKTGYIKFCLDTIDDKEADKRVRALKPNGGYDADFYFFYAKDNKNDQVTFPEHHVRLFLCFLACNRERRKVTKRSPTRLILIHLK